MLLQRIATKPFLHTLLPTAKDQGDFPPNLINLLLILRGSEVTKDVMIKVRCSS